MRERSIRAHLAVIATALLSAVALSMTTASAASAFSESYGFYEVGNSGFVQSAGAHTFSGTTAPPTKAGRLPANCSTTKEQTKSNTAMEGAQFSTTAANLCGLVSTTSPEGRR
jgi:hypothetical protein